MRIAEHSEQVNPFKKDEIELDDPSSGGWCTKSLRKKIPCDLWQNDYIGVYNPKKW